MASWGLLMRGDAEWAVRAVRPQRVVVLREGERSLLQAELSDADGRGIPSTSRLLRAVVLATPALSREMKLGVEIQREGSADPQQHGHTPPLTLPKKELGRFLQRITDTLKRDRERAEAARAKEAAEAAKVEAEATDAAEARAAARQATVLPAGTRRSSFRAGMAYVRDTAHRTWLEEEESDSDEPFEQEEKSSDGGSSSADSESASDSEGDDDDGGDPPGGVRRSRRAATAETREAVKRDLERRAGGAAADDESEEDDEDFVAAGSSSGSESENAEELVDEEELEGEEEEEEESSALSPRPTLAKRSSMRRRGR